MNGGNIQNDNHLPTRVDNAPLQDRCFLFSMALEGSHDQEVHCSLTIVEIDIYHTTCICRRLTTRLHSEVIECHPISFLIAGVFDLVGLLIESLDDYTIEYFLCEFIYANKK